MWWGGAQRQFFWVFAAGRVRIVVQIGIAGKDVWVISFKLNASKLLLQCDVLQILTNPRPLEGYRLYTS